MNLRPLGDRVVVLRLPAEDKVGSIFIPDTAKDKPTRARVVAVGPGKLVGDRFVEPSVKKDDIVLFGKYAGTEFKQDGQEYVCLTGDDILGVIE